MSDEEMGESFVFDAPGSVEEKVAVYCGVVFCGKERDGISLRLGGRGGFVVAFADLERAYLSAKGYRERHKERIAQSVRDFDAILAGEDDEEAAARLMRGVEVPSDLGRGKERKK